MKIGFFTDDYHPRVDGVVAYIDSMSRALDELGHEVFIICPEYPGHETSKGPVIRVDSYDPLPFSKLTSRMIITNKNTLKTTEELELDIIHAHTQSGANFAAYMLSERTDTKLVTTMHTTYHPLIEVYPGVTLVAVWMGNFLSWRYYHDMHALLSLVRFPFPIKKKIAVWMDSYVKSILDHSNLVVTNSAHTKKYVKRFGSKTNIKIVRNGIDRKRFSPVKKKKNNKETVFKFVLTSRISGEKRQDVAIRAVAELARDGYECHLTLVGGGPNRTKCEKLINDLGISDNVLITGEVEQKEVRAALANADAGLFTSYHFDTDPLAIMEYLSMGLPVVYCDENFDHMFKKGAAKRCGKDYSSFADAMKGLMSSKTNMDKMSKLAVESSDIHDIIDRARELEQVYAQLTKTKSD